MTATLDQTEQDLATLHQATALAATPQEQRDMALADQRQALLIKQAQRIAELDEQIERLYQERDLLKTRILEEHPTPGTYPAGDLKVQVKNGSRKLDAKRFAQAFPAADNPRLWELKPKSLTAVAKLVGELAVEDYVIRNKPSVVVA